MSRLTEPSPDEGRFVDATSPADVVVIVVTFRSADHLGPLLASLRGEATANRLRVIVIDNDSPDETLEVARACGDVIALAAGGNLGYAGGVNAALRIATDAAAILILNPDLVVEPGVVAALRRRLTQPGIGIVVPTIVSGTGELRHSLRREPTVLRGLGDALVGARLRRRPGIFAETVYTTEQYSQAGPVEWATGAALLISATAARTVGAWDEQFFLYSEETDYFRRTRDAGFRIWFEPSAVVRHSEGGSGASVALAALMAVNRVRYFRKYHGLMATSLFHLTAVIHELVRVASPLHRKLLPILIRPGSWPALERSLRTRRYQQRSAPHSTGEERT